MQLVTVRFTTKKLLSFFDAAGNKIRDAVEEVPQCIAGIPRSTAESYRSFGNWAIEPYYAEQGQSSSMRKTIFVSPRRAGKSNAAKIAAAAASGDYAAALNALSEHS